MEEYFFSVKREKVSPVVFWIVFISAAVMALFAFFQHSTLALELSSLDIEEHMLDISGKGTWENNGVKEGAGIEVSANDTLSKNEYSTPDGFKIISYSNKWGGGRLKEIYKELLNNKHGVELQYVNSVIVYPKGSEYGDFDILGTQSSLDTSFDVFADYRALLPKTLKYSVISSTSDICLYNMDKYDTIEEAAKTISHEYGHHYTRHYFFRDEEDIMSSDYYKIRGLREYPKAMEYDNYEDYMKNYEWSILEMAAEDYVQILGSQNAKITYDYKDIKEQLDYNLKTNREYKKDTRDYYNAYPQINIFMPLAAQVDGLDEYYHSFIDGGYKAKPVETSKINIYFKKGYAGKYAYYDVSWNKIKNGRLYTLVCYDKNGKIFCPVKTVKNNEKQTAVIGAASGVKSGYIHYWYNEILNDERMFKVYVLLSDGAIVSSKLVSKSF